MVLSQELDSKVLKMVIKVKSFDEKKQNGDWNGTNVGLFYSSKWDFITGIQSPRFCKWPWILNARKSI